MSVLALERPRTVTRPSDRLRRLLGELTARLEVWLPAEECRLQRARERGRPDPTGENEWQAALRLYERLCTAAAVGNPARR